MHASNVVRMSPGRASLTQRHTKICFKPLDKVLWEIDGLQTEVVVQYENDRFELILIPKTLCASKVLEQISRFGPPEWRKN